MQVLRTEVSSITTPGGLSVRRVVFCGEGGECVTVDMASEGEGTEAAAIDRARAILVQTATFSLALNDYDAQSNGNFDEVTVTAASDTSGVLYCFECRDGDGSRDLPPVLMPNMYAAQEEAIRFAIDLLVDLQPGLDDLDGWLVRVRDQQGEVLSVVDVRKAEAARQMRQ